MQTDNRLLNDLRNEHATLSDKIVAAKFAVVTLPFKTDDEKELLKTQIVSMENYATYLMKRAEIVAKRLYSEV